MSSSSKFLERVKVFTDPDEPVQYAVTGQVGIKPTWRFLSFWLVVTNKPRIIAVTPKRILVLRAGQFRSARTKPRQLLFDVPRSTVMGPLHGTWSRIRLGNESIWVSRNAYKLIEKANAAAATSGTPTAAS